MQKAFGKKSVIFLFIFPAFLIYTAFVIVSIVWAGYYSFFDWSGVGEKVFVGFKNYIELLTQDDVFRSTVWHTLIYTVINVADQQSDRNSVLNFYKELIRLRKSPEYKECFTYGGFTPVFTECDDIFAYLRTLEESHLQILVAANYGTKVQTLHLPSKMQEMLLSNMVCESELSDVLRLDSCQVVVVRLKGND